MTSKYFLQIILEYEKSIRHDEMSGSYPPEEREYYQDLFKSNKKELYKLVKAIANQSVVLRG
jgi:hypothetical protein